MKAQDAYRALDGLKGIRGITRWRSHRLVWALQTMNPEFRKMRTATLLRVADFWKARFGR